MQGSIRQYFIEGKGESSDSGVLRDDNILLDEKIEIARISGKKSFNI
jgi:hypothetical protein